MSREGSVRSVALAAVLLLLSSLPSTAMPILAEVSGCVAATCPHHG